MNTTLYHAYFISNKACYDKIFHQLKGCEHLASEPLWLHPNQIMNVCSPKNPYLIFIDESLTSEQQDWIRSHPFICQAFAVILFNQKQVPSPKHLSYWPNICAYFLRNDSLEKKLKLVNKVRQGECCFSPYMVKKLLVYWQQSLAINKQNILKLESSLTRKERAILQKLNIGMTNLDIADQFYVSEHTIKSHLYRIFKKIRVKNRRQAILWAKLYLSCEDDPSTQKQSQVS